MSILLITGAGASRNLGNDETPDRSTKDCEAELADTKRTRQPDHRQLWAIIALALEQAHLRGILALG